MTNKAIEQAVKIAGSQKKLANLCGVKQPTVWRWLHGGGITSRYVKAIVKATGGKVKPHELGKDLADLTEFLKLS
ncbi:helix-turn-helix domain-containing protein [Candidatus Fukatsuia endosymbiont of Tuberolachnus salignus]|uniref:helix-turn-helix domain-containing protein n=1 Tax=Candidatus Fukatsuia endosymbiont of Tuberolachnus salignus TaxID=3077957 RepID=UPI00313BEDA1